MLLKLPEGFREFRVIDGQRPELGHWGVGSDPHFLRLAPVEPISGLVLVSPKIDLPNPRRLRHHSRRRRSRLVNPRIVLLCERIDFQRIEKLLNLDGSLANL